MWSPTRSCFVNHYYRRVCNWPLLKVLSGWGKRIDTGIKLISGLYYFNKQDKSLRVYDCGIYVLPRVIQNLFVYRSYAWYCGIYLNYKLIISKIEYCRLQLNYRLQANTMLRLNLNRMALETNGLYGICLCSFVQILSFLI